MYMMKVKNYYSDYPTVPFKNVTYGTDETSFGKAEYDLKPEIYETEDEIVNKILQDGWEIDNKVVENGQLKSFTTKPILYNWSDTSYIEVVLVPLINITDKFETDTTKYLVKKTRFYTTRDNQVLINKREVVLPYICVGPKSIKTFAKTYLKDKKLDIISEKEKYIVTKSEICENNKFANYYDEYTLFSLVDTLGQQKG